MFLATQVYLAELNLSQFFFSSSKWKRCSLGREVLLVSVQRNVILRKNNEKLFECELDTEL